MEEEKLTTAEIDIEKQLEVYEPANSSVTPDNIYKVYEELKIPVSKYIGNLWKSRRDLVLSTTDDIRKAWDIATTYYLQDQRHNESEVSKDELINANYQQESENVVYSTITTTIPTLYSKNPTIEVSAHRDDMKEFASTVERVTNLVLSKRTGIGVNLKPKTKKGIINALLTNRGIIKLGYTYKTESSTEALKSLQDIGKKLSEATDSKEIELLEGQLMAIESTIDLLSPEGCFIKNINPLNILIDPDAKEQDASDAKWIMECDYIPTAYIIAKFCKDGKLGKNTSIYKDTHVIATAEISDTETDTIVITDKGQSDYEKLGYDNSYSYEKAKLTKVWYVWDKTTRRVYMFNDADWSYPIWVWNDPLQLEEFFPYYILSFWDNPNNANTKGEVSFYLDQQDGINKVNSEHSKARDWATNKIFYDIDLVTQETMSNFLSNKSKTALGIKVKEGKLLNDIIKSALPPSMEHNALFDKTDFYQTINRITGLSDAARGGQYKTNTTNSAIQQYQEVSNGRKDDKIDLIEDWIGQIGWGVAQLLMMNLSQQRVSDLLGNDKAIQWKEGISAEEISRFISVRVVGGSTQKPTTASKKQQAIELGQVLGQFASVSPIALLVSLRMFEQAFDEVTIKEEDWKQIQEDMKMRTGIEQPQQQQQASSPEDIVSKLSPEQQQAVVQMMNQGMPVEQALQQIQQGEPQ